MYRGNSRSTDHELWHTSTHVLSTAARSPTLSGGAIVSQARKLKVRSTPSALGRKLLTAVTVLTMTMGKAAAANRAMTLVGAEWERDLPACPRESRIGMRFFARPQ